MDDKADKQPADRSAGSAAELSAWRKAQRTAMRQRRGALDAKAKDDADAAIARHLECALKIEAGTCIAVYWPLTGEPDLRAWCSMRASAGQRLALPVVVAVNEPLVFRHWAVGESLARDALDIPCPPARIAVQPDIIIAPCVAFDAAGFRLGSGGGYYDRTLAETAQRPFLVGVAYDCLKLPSIRPQPHDVPFDKIISDERVYDSSARGA